MKKQGIKLSKNETSPSENCLSQGKLLNLLLRIYRNSNLQITCKDYKFGKRIVKQAQKLVRPTAIILVDLSLFKVI